MAKPLDIWSAGECSLRLRRILLRGGIECALRLRRILLEDGIQGRAPAAPDLARGRVRPRGALRPCRILLEGETEGRAPAVPDLSQRAGLSAAPAAPDLVETQNAMPRHRVLFVFLGDASAVAGAGGTF